MGRAIYVSSVNGDDANSGYAPEKAFRSLRKVNQMEIQPGDQILLERGSVFVGEYLHLYRGGTQRFFYTMQNTFPSGIWKLQTTHASKMSA